MRRVSRAELAAFLAIALISLISFFPLDLGIALLGLDRVVTARRAEGPVWSGKLYDTRLGDMQVGLVGVKLRVLPLLTGRARVDIWNPTGIGAVSAWPGGRGIDDVSATLPAASLANVLPADRLVLEDVTAHFSGGSCVRGDGRVRLTLANQIAGLDLPGGLSGTLRCEGRELVVPLTSANGLATLNLRLDASGRYRGRLLLRVSDAGLAQILTGQGFASTRGGYALPVSGAF